MQIVYASFDEVPSFKAASTHILANCRASLGRHALTLLTLGELVLPAHAGFRHLPVSLQEDNYLRRGERFRAHVRQHLQRQRPDLLHFRTPWEGVLARELDLPSVYEVNGLPSIELPYLYRAAPPRVLDRLHAWEQQCLTHAQAIICPSTRIRDCLLQRYVINDPERITVIPNGYDIVPTRPVPSFDRPLRAVYIGALQPWQGIAWALRSFAELRDCWTLDIYAAGQSIWRKRLEKRIRRYDLQDLVRILPPLERTELDAVLGNYHAGLAPLLKTSRNSEQGCCPVKIMDYLAHGLVTVAADLAAVRELLENGRNACLFAPNSRQDFSLTMQSLFERRDELPVLRQQVLDSLAKMPTWEECGRRLGEIHEQAAMARINRR